MSETVDGMNEYLDKAATSHAQKGVNVQKVPNPPTNPMQPPVLSLGARPKVKKPYQPIISHKPDTDTGPQRKTDHNNKFHDVMERQTAITEMLVKQLLPACLPQRDVPVFCGDPPDFRSFLMAFQHIVAMIMMQTSASFWSSSRGETHDLVNSCQHSPGL